MKVFIAVAAIIASTAIFAHAAEIPDTPAGHALAMWIGAMNSGDAAKLQAYIDKYHRKGTPQGWLQLRHVVGDLSILKLEKNEPNDIVAILSESLSDDALRAQYQIDPADPTKITAGQIAGVDRPEEFAIPRLSRAEALKALNARADGLVAQDKIMGVMLVENHGRILLEKAWGYADRQAKVPLRVTDKFRLGSMNKMFTAVATLQLVAKSKLSLDGTVGR